MSFNKFKLYPFVLRIMKLNKSPFRISNSLKFIYVLEGSLCISFTSNNNILKKNQVEIINIDEPYRLTSLDNECTIAIIDLEKRFVDSKFKKNKNIIYNCTSNEFYEGGSSAESIDKLQIFLSSLISKIIIGDKFNIEQYSENLINLMEDFDDIKNLLDKSQSNLRSERFYGIINFIHSNLKYNITLDDIENIEYLTKEYLSREFSKHLGKSFKEIQGYYRTIKACRLLLNTNENIDNISLESGFSSKSYFYKYFRLYYNCTPNNFRLENQNAEINSSALTSEELRCIVNNLLIINKYKIHKKSDNVSSLLESELRINYDSSRTIIIPDTIPAKYLKNINLEVDLKNIEYEQIDEFFKEIIEWILENDIVISRITFRIDIEHHISSKWIKTISSFDKTIQSLLISTTYNPQINVCIEI